ncbi:MAG: response regulator [Deltaproteobacteria bacterium]|nr:response regulator [Deltaproteobacteria bacterium]
MTQHLLIVDDEASILFALQDYFSFKGYRVDCAEDRQSAQALLANARRAGTGYDVVVTDLSLNGRDSTDGLDVIEHACAHAPHCRVILLSGNLTKQLEREAYARGVHGVFNKGIPLPELEIAVAALIGGNS